MFIERIRYFVGKVEEPRGSKREVLIGASPRYNVSAHGGNQVMYSTRWGFSPLSRLACILPVDTIQTCER